MEPQRKLVWSTSCIKCLLRWGLSALWICRYCSNSLFTNWLRHVLELISFFALFLLRGYSRVSLQLSSNPQSEYIQAWFTSKPNLYLCPNTAFYSQELCSLPGAFRVMDRNRNFSFKFNSYDGLFMSLIILAWFCTSVSLHPEAHVSWVWMTELDTQTSLFYPSEREKKSPSTSNVGTIRRGIENTTSFMPLFKPVTWSRLECLLQLCFP